MSNSFAGSHPARAGRVCSDSDRFIAIEEDGGSCWMIRLLEAHPSGRAKARSLNKFSVEQLRWFASCASMNRLVW